MTQSAQHVTKPLSSSCPPHSFSDCLFFYFIFLDLSKPSARAYRHPPSACILSVYRTIPSSVFLLNKRTFRRRRWRQWRPIERTVEYFFSFSFHKREAGLSVWVVTIGGMAVDQDANVQLSSCPMGLTRRRRHHQVETSEIQGTRNERQQRRETNKVKKKKRTGTRTHAHAQLFWIKCCCCHYDNNNIKK